MQTMLPRYTLGPAGEPVLGGALLYQS